MCAGRNSVNWCGIVGRLWLAVFGVLIANTAWTQTRVTGTATYSESFVLPADAIFEATLEDVSRAGARAVVIGRIRIERPGRPPFTFHIDYDLTRLYARGRYVVRARITRRAQLLFTTTQSYPVLTSGAGSTVSMVMQAVPGRADFPTARLGRLPASFEGELPCADCSGIRAHLDLFPDRTFVLRTTYRDRRSVPLSTGRWVLSSDREILRLQGSDSGLTLLSVQSAGVLGLLDLDGQAITSPLRARLTRLSRFTPLLARADPAGGPIATPSLTTTGWRLIRVAGRSVEPTDTAQPPTVQFSNSGQVAGSTGCNRLTGRYAVMGARLSLPALATTRMACAVGSDVEGLFLAALGRAETFRLVGDWLDLLDGGGALQVRFEAAPFLSAVAVSD